MRYRKRYRPKGLYGTRYRSTRKYPGLIRKPAQYAVYGSARKRYGRRQIMSVIRSVAEHKYWDTGAQIDGPSWVSSSGLLYVLTNVPQGSGDAQRIGDKITLTSLEFLHSFYPYKSIFTQQDYTFRITIFVWKDDTTPNLNDIYNDPVSNSNDDSPNLWHFNHDKRVKRKILFDRSYATSQQQVLNGLSTQYYALENTHRTEKIVIPLHKLKNKLNIVNFENNSLVAINHIYVYFSSSVPLANITSQTEYPFVHAFENRINFIDM